MSEEARARYLGIVWRTAKPPRAEPYYRYGNYGNVLPRNILENALKITVTENDKADRPITHILYVRGREMRLCQELILGIGEPLIGRRISRNGFAKACRELNWEYENQIPRKP